jgi:hypothetical protein
MTSVVTNSQSSKLSPWYRPIISPEHGVYVMLAVSFLTGAAAAQRWTWGTNLALIAVFCAFQAEYPLIWQFKQRKTWKPRLLLWGSLYSIVAVAIALWLLWQNSHRLPLFLIYGGAIAALIFDLISVFYRQQKSRLNELVTFAGVCLSAPLAYTVTLDGISQLAHREAVLFEIALWVINTLFFSSAIFTVKLRKTKTASIIPSVIFHVIATGIVVIFWLAGFLTPITASAFGVALVKFAFILWQKDWYCTGKIQQVALLETFSSLIFLIVVALSVLPAHLSSS